MAYYACNCIGPEFARPLEEASGLMRMFAANRNIAVTLVLLAGCAAAWADVVPAQAWARDGVAAVAANAPAAQPVECRLRDLNWLLHGSDALAPGGLPLATGTDVEPAAATPPGMTELPPPPSSLSLVLSALASFGAYQSVRSLKRLHLSHLPDWYHTGAVQIGHVKVFELDAVVFEPCFGLALPSQKPLEHPVLELALPPVPDLIPTRAPRSPPR